MLSKLSILVARRSVRRAKSLSTSPIFRVASHTNTNVSAEHYFKDVDDTPPANHTVYKVDPASDAVQLAQEPPTSCPWSQAGALTQEYQTVSRKEPYDVPAPPASAGSMGRGENGTGKKLRYGGMKYANEEAASFGEGPEGSERCGRKPERR